MFSRRDLDAASSPLSHSLLLIVGRILPGPPALGAFVFERSELDHPDVGYRDLAKLVIAIERWRAKNATVRLRKATTVVAFSSANTSA
jgi:hypothetical protein